MPSQVDKETIRRKVIEALKKVYDPEIPVDVWNLGLVYGIDVDDEGKVKIIMTLTAPGCPVTGIVVMQAEEAVKEYVPEAKDVEVEVTFDPPWDPRRVTPEGRRLLKEIFGYDVVEEWIKRMEEAEQQA
ncbi:MAG: iron-sulfur cluster assembly protein [Pyrodictiaceae archaeon]